MMIDTSQTLQRPLSNKRRNRHETNCCRPSLTHKRFIKPIFGIELHKIVKKTKVMIKNVTRIEIFILMRKHNVFILIAIQSG